MNYCVVAFAIILLLSTIQWFADGRKNYEGPRITLQNEQERVVVHEEYGGIDKADTGGR